MLILVPWKPVVIVFGFLAALMLFSYFGTALLIRPTTIGLMKHN